MFHHKSGPYKNRLMPFKEGHHKPVDATNPKLDAAHDELHKMIKKHGYAKARQILAEQRKKAYGD